MKTRMALMVGAIALAPIGAPVALGQNITINEFVQRLVAQAAGPGEKMIDTIKLEELDVDDSTEFIFKVDPAKTYHVYGACDDDCYDINLRAYDSDENELDYDDEEGDEAMLIIGPGDAGDELHIVIDLLDCDTGTCVVGVGVYEAAP